MPGDAQLSSRESSLLCPLGNFIPQNPLSQKREPAGARFCKGSGWGGLRHEPPFTGVSGPSGPKSQKRLKKSLFGSEKSPRKCPKKSKNAHFQAFCDIFGLFRTFFGTFLRPQKSSFEFFFFDFGPGGPRDSCKWRLGWEGVAPQEKRNFVSKMARKKSVSIPRLFLGEQKVGPLLGRNAMNTTNSYHDTPPTCTARFLQKRLEQC